MSWKGLLVLLILAAAAAYGVYEYRLKPPPSADAAPETAPLADLAASLDRIDGLRVTGADDELAAELSRGEQGWVVDNRYGYPAERDTVNELLLNLADAELIENKTSKPELYPRLGLADPGSGDGAGTRVELHMTGVETPLELILGDPAGGGDGTYLRRADDPQSYLLSGVIVASTDIQQWLSQPIVELPAERFQRVVLHHPDGESLTVAKQNRGDVNFEPLRLLDDREMLSDTEANPIGNVLANLRAEDVRPAAEFEPEEREGVQAEFYGFDGLKITVKTFQEDDAYWLHLRAGFDPEQAQSFAETPAAEGETNEGDEAAGGETDDTAVQDADEGSGEDADGDSPEQQAERIDRRTADWVYRISEYKYRHLNKRLGDLLQPEEPPAEAGVPATPGADAQRPDAAAPGQTD